MAFINRCKQGIFSVIGVTLMGSFALATPAKAAVQNRQGSERVQELPGSTSQLPLISFLGFGMLTGGLISALRTRPQKQAEKF
jgi:hypothetical protein